VGGKVGDKAEVSKKKYAEHVSWDEKKALRQLSKMKSLALIGDNGKTARKAPYGHSHGHCISEDE